MSGDDHSTARPATALESTGGPPISRPPTDDPDATWDADGSSPRRSGPTLLAGRYAVGALIGRGGSGQVHAATDALTRETVAVKFVRGLSRSDRRQLRRELTALRLLELPGVARLLDDGEDGGQTFLVMGLLPGGPISALAGPYERWAPAARILVETLARVHYAGVIHRDLKPGNILLDAEGRPVITDFGLAQGRSVEASGGTLEGTPRYMPPEQAAGQPCDERSDLYALGAVLWELLVGDRFPPPGPERRRVLTAGGPDALGPMVMRLLEPDPRARPHSAEEVLAALGGGDAVLGPLPDLPDPVDATALAALVGEGARTFLHLAEDTASLVLARTRGDLGAVRRLLASWIRSGRCHWDDRHLRIDRAAIAALRWEGHPDARRIARLTRDRPDPELADAAIQGSDAAWDEGAPGRALAILESVLPALDDESAATAVRHALAERALYLDDATSVRRALYRAERAGDAGLVLLLQGARLCASQEMQRAADVLRRPNPLPDALEAWRIGLLSKALGRLDRDAQAVHLAGAEAWCSADPLRRARWLGWRGLAHYAAARYGPALQDHEASAALLGQHPVERMAAVVNAAAAALETGALARAEGFAEEGERLGRELRHPVAECSAAGLLRAARYRAGTAGPPLPELVEAAAAVSPAHEAQHAMTEAAVAWRAGHPSAAELALAGARAYARLGWPDGEGLASAIALAAGAPVDPAEVRRLVRLTRDPTLALQATALALPGRAAELPVAEWLAAWHLPDPALRADVLSREECRLRLT